MTAVENMMRMLLKSLDVNVDDIKQEVTSRIAAFEKNIDTLNATLISLQQRTQRMELMLEAISASLNIETPPATEQIVTQGFSIANGSGEHSK